MTVKKTEKALKINENINDEHFIKKMCVIYLI